MENRQDRDDRQARRRGTLRLVIIILGAGALLGGLACFYAGWHDSRTVAALTDHGVTTSGQWVRGHVSISRNERNRGGMHRATRYDRYRYQVAGRSYEIEDAGTGMVPQRRSRSYDVLTGPRTGMPRIAPIVYLPEQPSAARLRMQLVSGARVTIIIGAWLTIAGLLMLAGGWWLSRAKD